MMLQYDLVGEFRKVVLVVRLKIESLDQVYFGDTQSKVGEEKNG